MAHNISHQTWIEVGVTAAVIPVVFVVSQLRGYAAVQTAISDIAAIPNPLWRMLQVGLEAPALVFASKYELQMQVRDLQQQYATTLVQLSELEQLRTENEQLRQVVDVVASGEHVRVATPLVSYAQPALVGGSKEGITVGQVVVTSGQLLGVISEVSAGTSRVVLLQERNSPTILVETDTGVQGVIRGTGKSIQLTHVPVTEQLESGQRIVTVGQEQIPAGLLVGVITQVQSNPADPIQSAVVSQPSNFFEQQFVEIR